MQENSENNCKSIRRIQSKILERLSPQSPCYINLTLNLNIINIDFRYKEEEPNHFQIAVADNMAILKKWTNGQNLAKVTLSMPDNLRLRYIKHYPLKLIEENCRINHFKRSHQESRLWMEICLSYLLTIKQPSDKFDNHYLRRILNKQKYLPYTHTDMPLSKLGDIAQAIYCELNSSSSRIAATNKGVWDRRPQSREPSILQFYHDDRFDDTYVIRSAHSESRLIKKEKLPSC
ncbi:hypothetical protein RF11_00631 [Thelohanellus kitauei]|uniref:Uncharacterized protein n=1 Tax=Thelohanellus kitauei TaxID=669202 RepID=A0A0C2IYB4_THEKT|nr:hypothetical protein RF11_00631 [Thelohanellus kitauei]